VPTKIFLRLTVVAVLALAGCSATSPAPGSPTASATRVPGPTGGQSTVPVSVRRDLPWTDLGPRPAPSLGGLGIASDRYLIVNDPDEHGVTVTRRSDGHMVLHHRVERPEFQPIFADIAGDTAVLVDEDTESNGDGSKDPARSYIYDLLTGSVTPLSQIPSAPPASVFGRQATVTDDGRYFYSASVERPGNRYQNCVGMVDLKSKQGSTVECAGAGENETDGYYLGAGEDGATWLHVAGPAIESCRTGRGMRGTTVIEVGVTNGCATMGTTTVGGWSVWSATPGPAMTPMPTLDLLATDGHQTVRLGPVNGVALTTCGSYAYWRVEDRQSVQLRRWKPGMSTVEVAYEVTWTDSDTAVHALAFGGCADKLFSLLAGTIDQSSATMRLLTLAS
jgi:hypothetical protein